MDITYAIEDQIDLANVLKKKLPRMGWRICDLRHYGKRRMFSIRDPWGIRPAFWYADDGSRSTGIGTSGPTNGL